MSFLNNFNKDFFLKEGYLVVPSFASKVQVNALRGAYKEIIENYDYKSLNIFSTAEQQRNDNTYFFESSDRISVFFEEAIQDCLPSQDIDYSKYVNKLAHALHDKNDVFHQFSYQNKLYHLSLELGFQIPVIIQSMYICKMPKIGSEIHLHQDSTFLYTEPKSCIGFWVALEDATVENGCMWGIPGSHKKYKNDRRFVRGKEYNSTKFIGKWDDWELSEMIPLEVKAGDILIFDGDFVHGSKNNLSNKSRHAYVMHMIDANCTYPEDNWLQRSDLLTFKDQLTKKAS